MSDDVDDHQGAHTASSYSDGTSTAESELSGAPAEKFAMMQHQMLLDQQLETNKQTKHDNGLRNRVALGILLVTTVQLGLVDAAFFCYGYALRWHIPTPAISAWVGGVVVEVASLAVVVIRYLFPERRPT